MHIIHRKDVSVLYTFVRAYNIHTRQMFDKSEAEQASERGANVCCKSISSRYCVLMLKKTLVGDWNSTHSYARFLLMPTQNNANSRNERWRSNMGQWMRYRVCVVRARTYARRENFGDFFFPFFSFLHLLHIYASIHPTNHPDNSQHLFN